MRQIDGIAMVLLVVGALNWGLVGFTGVDLVAALFGLRFGETSAVTSAIYGLVGIAGVYRLVAGKAVHNRTLPATAR